MNFKNQWIISTEKVVYCNIFIQIYLKSFWVLLGLGKSMYCYLIVFLDFVVILKYKKIHFSMLKCSAKNKAYLHMYIYERSSTLSSCLGNFTILIILVIVNDFALLAMKTVCDCTVFIYLLREMWVMLPAVCFISINLR